MIIPHRRIKEDYRALQIERDDWNRVLVRAQMELRRMEGFEEGLKQGRVLGEDRILKLLVLIGGLVNDLQTPKALLNMMGILRVWMLVPVKPLWKRKWLYLLFDLLNVKMNVQLELKAVERELNVEREKMKDVEKEKGQLEKAVRVSQRREAVEG